MCIPSQLSIQRSQLTPQGAAEGMKRQDPSLAIATSHDSLPLALSTGTYGVLTYSNLQIPSYRVNILVDIPIAKGNPYVCTAVIVGRSYTMPHVYPSISSTSGTAAGPPLCSLSNREYILRSYLHLIITPAPSRFVMHWLSHRSK